MSISNGSDALEQEGSPNTTNRKLSQVVSSSYQQVMFSDMGSSFRHLSQAETISCLEFHMIKFQVD
jgi:hypothetical protein